MHPPLSRMARLLGEARPCLVEADSIKTAMVRFNTVFHRRMDYRVCSANVG